MDVQALYRKDWEVLKPLQQPTDAGRRLDVGGFVLGDSFDTLLRKISEKYLEEAWTSLSAVLKQQHLVCNDLSWGWMHPGETGFPDVGRVAKNSSAPSDFIGWTSHDLSEIWRTDECERLDTELKVKEPSLRCTATWRSLKWSIAPTDYCLALKLIEAMCTDEVSDRHPNVVLQHIVQPIEVWRKMAEAIRENNQHLLDILVEEARQTYSHLGFRILIRGYQTYLRSGGHEDGFPCRCWFDERQPKASRCGRTRRCTRPPTACVSLVPRFTPSFRRRVSLVVLSRRAA